MIYPELTWGDLINFSKNKMSGDWFSRAWDNIQGAFSDAGDQIGDWLGDAGDKVGDWLGDGVRLITDEKVVDGLTDYYSAYKSGGQSTALDKFLGQMFTEQQKANMLASMGAKSLDAKTLGLLAGGGFAVFLLLKTIGPAPKKPTTETVKNANP